MFGSNLPSFFKQRKPKRFEYKPMYYDADKEQLKNRIARIKAQVDNEKEQTEYNSEGLSYNMRSTWGKTDRKQLRKKSNLRLVVIFGVLALLAWFFLYT